eukprot:gene9702-13080_t
MLAAFVFSPAVLAPKGSPDKAADRPGAEPHQTQNERRPPTTLRGVFQGDLEADKVGGLICGWMIHNKDGSPMRAGAHPALAQGKVRYVGDHVCVIVAETLAQARDASEAIVVDYDVLPAVVDTARAAGAKTVVHAEAPDNTVFNWHLGNKDETEAAFKAAKHVTKLDIVNNRLVPNPMEPRAAVGDYEAGEGIFTLYTTSHHPQRGPCPDQGPGQGGCRHHRGPLDRRRPRKGTRMLADAFAAERLRFFKARGTVFWSLAFVPIVSILIGLVQGLLMRNLLARAAAEAPDRRREPRERTSRQP